MPEIITPSNSNLSRQALQLQAANKRIIRLFRGAYIDAEEYNALDSAGRYRARAEAFRVTHPKLQAWGITAAALEGAPVLSGAPLHFAGAPGSTKSKQEGCVFHETLPDTSPANNRTAQTLFECAISSPLPDALLAANHLLRCASEKARGALSAYRELDEKTTEALLWQPIKPDSRRAQPRNASDISKLDTKKPGFLKAYSATRRVEFASPEAELVWLDFAQLCVIYGKRRGIRKALHAGLYFSDQLESPAESLLVARCVELGFEVPLLQVNILNPISGKHLGRVDGLWPSKSVAKGLYQSDSKFGRYLQSRQLGDNDSIVIEFDGRLKHQQNDVESLDKERLRQNAIGNLGFRFIRVGWDDLMQPDDLRSIFKAARVPRSRYK